METKIIADWVEYQEGAVVSRTILKKPKGNITLFAFDRGESLSEHTTPHDALIFVVEGEARVTISGEPHVIPAGGAIHLPAGEPHAVMALTRFKMVLVMIQG